MAGEVAKQTSATAFLSHFQAPRVLSTRLPEPANSPCPHHLQLVKGAGKERASFRAYLCPSQPAPSTFLKRGKKGSARDGTHSPAVSKAHPSPAFSQDRTSSVPSQRASSSTFLPAKPEPGGRPHPAPYLGTYVASERSTAPASREKPGGMAVPPETPGKLSSRVRFRVKMHLENTPQGVVSL